MEVGSEQSKESKTKDISVFESFLCHRGSNVSLTTSILPSPLFVFGYHPSDIN